MSDFTELEFKYSADSVKLEDFKALMKELPIVRSTECSSWDYYFVSNTNPEHFMRFRHGSNPELTIKRKVKANNNWHRIECDLPLDTSRLTIETVSTFADLLDYKQNFKIFKNCFVYWLEDVNFVFYVTYDENLKELNRFVEVEINKSRVSKLDNPTEVLKEYERKLDKLGIKPANRMKRSLFELYYKSDT
jgi:adenylate cyclase class IV